MKVDAIESTSNETRYDNWEVKNETLSRSDNLQLHAPPTRQDPNSTLATRVVGALSTPIVIPDDTKKNLKPIGPLPQFHGDTNEDAHNHIREFEMSMVVSRIMDSAHQMIMFTAILTGEARRWYYHLLVASINILDELYQSFLKEFGLKYDVDCMMLTLNMIQQEPGELVRLYVR
ncbi:hypothetical protein O6H91_03G051200 [Diphasiastrum complanatum]|uniref:Uncharacterized protein n=1 Tax=Diphasiastrum complanatum TaxID=34168 RepID=A0ACC2E6J4_DIPCM|nr:hypothetical protein O6H91_03G051200 [Diphasiastrum complanatum]